MNVAPGDRVDRYELEALLGEGGQGSVWRATDPLAPGVPRAVKLVSIHRAEPTSLERARREARALARLEHPSLCRCYGLFEDVKLDVLGFAMDFVDGMSLADAAGDPRMTPAMQDAALGHVASALAYVHANGLVHRDVKPENVLLESAFWDKPGDPRHVKLVDFGIAVGGFGARLTKVGHGIGTPPYMAPEQIEPLRWGEARSPATDVFAFGVLVWLVATGRHPTGLDGSASFGDYAVAYRQAADSMAWPPRLPVVSGFAAVLPRCLALHPPDRWRDAAAMLEPLGGKRIPKTVDDLSGAGGGGRTKTEPFEPPTAPDRTPRPPPTVEQRPVVDRGEQRGSRPASGQRQGRRWQAAAAVGAAALLGAVVLGVSLGADEESETEEERRPRRAVEPKRSAPTESAPPPAEVSVQRPAPEPIVLTTTPRPTTVTCAERDDKICENRPLCASGRRCDDIEHCDEFLEPKRPWYLRLSDIGESGKALAPARKAEIEVCLSALRDPGTVVCTRAADAGAPRAQRLRVRTEDITQGGLRIEVRSSSGVVSESTKPVVRYPIKRGALCIGIQYDNRYAAFTGSITKVSFFLDEAPRQPPPTWPVRCDSQPCVTADGGPGRRCGETGECFNPCLPGMGPEHGGTYCARLCRSTAECAHGTCEHGVCNTWPGSACEDPIGCCKRGLILYGGTHCAKPCKLAVDCPGGWCLEGICGPLCPSEGCPYLWE